MKNTRWIVGFALSFLMATTAFAAAYYNVTGWGRSFGGCYGGFSWRSCVRNLEGRAETDARWDAENKCRRMDGRLQSPYPRYCNTRCTPYFEPPDRQYAGVNCNADCDYTCVVDN